MLPHAASELGNCGGSRARDKPGCVFKGSLRLETGRLIGGLKSVQMKSDGGLG